MSKWDLASNEARTGASFDPRLADFSYVEALCLTAIGAARADILEQLELSLNPDLFWRRYNNNDAVRLTARLYAETCRYDEALALLDSITDMPTADADYIRIFSLYGAGRISEARDAAVFALDRWPFDCRFPRIVLQRENSTGEDASASELTALVLSRLHIWEKLDRELFLYAVRFEPDPKNRERYIRMYRGMGNSDLNNSAQRLLQLSCIIALENGTLTEKEAIDELFSYENDGIEISNLVALSSLTGSRENREYLASLLDNYSGILIDDTNNDGITDTFISYELGRPKQVVFDPDQDGYPDYTVNCDYGTPVEITLRNKEVLISYDLYPVIESVKNTPREYILNPGAFSWNPVSWTRIEELLPEITFYIFRLSEQHAFPGEEEIIQRSAFYLETEKASPDSELRVVLEKGMPVLSEFRETGMLVSWTSFANGMPVLTKEDRNNDGYFETTIIFNRDGSISSIQIDQNANRINEYEEFYYPDGSFSIHWDTDEDGTADIIWRKDALGREQTEWVHPSTGLPVVVTVENGIPVSVLSGSSYFPVVKDPKEHLWWLGNIPENSSDLSKKLIDFFNRSAASVVSITVKIDEKIVYAVSTGGFLYAEIF
ncbi:tetratricopeptide repeat protein [Brucepastera parasyntrophica]|uniref:tetratricopeptide repeat protein n=1 Tax=Brucepastera parasyntrophica TaxID=2880008 RepID=UPI0021095C5C|nr:tetratricopeptide repeat protein [Brucepastera parasyntrophica]ULQ60481.1 tetratricopeptide repeat protein [Brucepastera parasyntrophica]